MSRIETLLAAMTLPEKLGQLTMTASSYAVTGPIIAGDSTESIRNGTLGNLLNMIGAGPVHEMQKIAVEESRLGIPLLIGLDVIHGHRTLFPIPLAEARSSMPTAWKRTAREAACETAADGLAIDLCADARRVARSALGSAPRKGRAKIPGSRSRSRAKVRGYQGADLSLPESRRRLREAFLRLRPGDAGREYASVDISEAHVARGAPAAPSQPRCEPESFRSCLPSPI